MPSDAAEMLVFAGSSGGDFAQALCSYGGWRLGESEVITFSDGNLFVRIGENVRSRDVYLVQPIGLEPSEEFVEILFWADAFKRASAASVTAVIPYFGYAKGDKKDEPRVSLRARVCAECLELEGVDRVVTMDLHSAQIQGFFRIPVDHLYAYPVLSEYVKTLGLRDPVVVSPDAGFTKRARMYAQYLGTPLAIGDKIRRGHDESSEIVELVGDVAGRDVILTDDFSTTGSTLVGISHELKARGAKRQVACLSHVLLRHDGLERLEACPLELVIGTDTVHNTYLSRSDKIRIVSIAPLFAEALRRIHARESVSSLFAKMPAGVVRNAFPHA